VVSVSCRLGIRQYVFIMQNVTKYVSKVTQSNIRLRCEYVTGLYLILPRDLESAVVAFQQSAVFFYAGHTAESHGRRYT